MLTLFPPTRSTKCLRDEPATARRQLEEARRAPAHKADDDKWCSELDGRLGYIPSAGVGLLNSAL